jgi:hypothetical protein
LKGQGNSYQGKANGAGRVNVDFWKQFQNILGNLSGSKRTVLAAEYGFLDIISGHSG